MSRVSPASVDSRQTSEREQLADVGFMTCMTLTLLGNYAQTGHFGGPVAYTPFNVAAHLAGPESGGLRYDYRRPKHPYADKFMLAAGHCATTCYALWMIMGEAMYRIDRSLFHITSNPGIRRVSGIMLGRCSDITANKPDF